MLEEDTNKKLASNKATITTTTATNVEQQQKNNQQQTENQFAQVSQDMSELVYHLNTIQNDISELAGRPISLTKIED